MPYWGFFLLGVAHYLAFKLLNICYAFTFDPSNYTNVPLSVVKQTMARGEFPWWTHEIAMGIPLFFYGGFDLKIVPLLPYFEVIDLQILHASMSLFIGGLSFFEMARRVMKLDVASSFAGALMWIFNGQLVWYYYDTAVDVSFIWVPFIILAMYLFIQASKWQTRALSLGAMIVVMVDQIYTGRFDTLEFAYVSVILFAGIQSYFFWGRRKTALAVLAFGIAFSLACLICLPFLMEQMSIILQSERFGGVKSHMAQPTFLNAFSLFYHSGIFNIWGSWGPYTYVGIFNMALIVFGFIHSKSRPILFAYLAVAALSLICTFDMEIFGVHPLNDIIKQLPGHKGLKYVQRIAYISMFFVSLVFAHGFSTFLNSKTRYTMWLMAAVGLLCGVYQGYYIGTRSMFDAIFVSHTILLLANGLGLLLISIFRKPSFVLFLSMTLIISTSYLMNWSDSEPFGEPLAFYKKFTQTMPLDVKEFLLSQNDSKSYRTMNLGTFDQKNGTDSLPNLVASWGLGSNFGYFPLLNRHRMDFIRKVFKGVGGGGNLIPTPTWEGIAAGGYNLTGTKYWIVPRQDSHIPIIENLGFQKIFQSQGNFDVYQNPKAFPKAYLVDDAIVLGGLSVAAENISNKLASDPQWFQNGVFLNLNDKQVPPSFVVRGTTETDKKSLTKNLTLKKFQNDHITYEVDTDQGALLTILETLESPHWKGLVDGVETQLMYANGVFRAIQVPPGTHTVEFSYRFSWWIKLASIVGFVSLGILLLGPFVTFFRKARA